MPTPTVYDPGRLAAPQYLPLAAAILYPSPAAPALGTQVTSIKLVNVTAAPVLATVYVVVGAGAPAAVNSLCYQFSVPADGLPYEILDSQEQFMLNASDTIQGVAGAANSIVIHLSGWEYS